MEENKEHKELIHAFHLTWDEFPGLARLIDKRNLVIACNKAALSAGLSVGQICAKIGSPEIHKGCKKALALSTGTAQWERVAENRIRGWLPVQGYPEIVVHFSAVLPELNKK